MNHQALKDKILTGPAAAACAQYVVLPTDPKVPGHVVRERDQAIADLINAQDPMLGEVSSRLIGIGTVLNVLGPTDGAAVLDTLDAMRASVSPLKWAWTLLERDALDVGLDATRAQLQALVGVSFTQAQANTILNLARSATVVSGADVSIALRGI